MTTSFWKAKRLKPSTSSRSGKVKVLRHSTDGKDVVLRVVGPGQLLGSVAVFDGGGYPGTAQAIEDCALLVDLPQ